MINQLFLGRKRFVIGQSEKSFSISKVSVQIPVENRSEISSVSHLSGAIFKAFKKGK